MNPILRSTLFISLSIFLFACKTDTTLTLFNGENLDNWNIYLSSPDVEAEDLFWVEDGLINTAGKPHGYIRTKESYTDYKLHLEWRWVEEPTNSGVLLHVQGQDMIWPLAIECQLMAGKAGDVVLIGKGSGITIEDSTYLIESEENRYAVIPKFENPSENSPGEWNNYDITSKNGNLEVKVNGTLQNTGSAMTLTEGNIVLQSEGSAMQFRNIYLEKL